METYSLVILLIILVTMSAFFSASETALTAFNRSKLKAIAEKNQRKADLLKGWLKKPNEILTALLIGNNIVNILASSIATMVAISILGNNSRAIAISTGAMTILLLIFGEITPKVVAKAYSTHISNAVIKLVYMLSKLFLPISKILMVVSKLIARIFGVKIDEIAFLITEEEIKSVVSVGEEEGVIEEEEKKMIHSIFEFTDTTVKEIMIPRTTVFAVEASKTLEEIWDVITGNGYSRIPVYEEGIDNIIGVFYIKDIFNVIRDGKLNMQVKSFIREAYFVPETKALVEMLEEFKKKHIHMAIVLDEYGGTSGIITIEDLIEEIVGDINDEFDIEHDEEIKKVADNKYIIDAMLDVEFLNEELSIDLPVSEDYDSLGGYIYSVLGRVPLEKDTITHDNGKVEIRVLEVDNRRIVKALIIKREEKEKDE
ncbi:MAG: HlyC/CorC family transporter [Fusobacteriaceae bacterium]|nr:HlyC/CorC family transporter [Fusobacteriaceae bacterium]MBP9595656.1 HlyC/CorC family transporter [Fusobacteriaceae bacterium]MBU9918315.1 hemolysin family protein [Fusobacteriaceae bacterium]